MSARSALEGRLIVFGLSEQAAKRAVDEHAHELAEKIRRAYFGNGDPLGRHATTPVTNAWVAADLIDPEHDGS